MNGTVGIDCGLDGAIIIIDSSSKIVEDMAMPVIKTGKGRKIDQAKLNTLFQEWKSRDLAVSIEDPGKHAPSAKALWSLTYCFASLETLAIAHRLPYLTERAIVWQAHFWKRPKMPKGTKFDTKAAAILAASRLWPVYEPTGNAKLREGKIDALLIAEYGRQKLMR